MAFLETGVSSAATIMRNMEKKQRGCWGWYWLVKNAVSQRSGDAGSARNNVVLMSETLLFVFLIITYSLHSTLFHARHLVITIYVGCAWVVILWYFLSCVRVMWAARKLPRDVLCESETHNDHLAHALFLLFLSPFSTNKLFSSTMSIIDNLKEHINHSLVFRIINIVVACFMVIGGVCVILTGGGFLHHGHNNHRTLSLQHHRYHVRIPTIYSRHLLHCFWCHGICI